MSNQGGWYKSKRKPFSHKTPSARKGMLFNYWWRKLYNVARTCLVSKLNLKIKHHPKTYKLQWLNENV